MSRFVIPSGSEAVRSEAWRAFCRPGTKFCGLYEPKALTELKVLTE